MPVFSLPNKYGIGSFGDEAYRFVDFLAATGQSYWQVLPLSPTSFGDSPYQSPSAFAGNPYFIDLDLLRMDGLLTDEECNAEQTKVRMIDYAKLYHRRYVVLKKAFVRFWKPRSYEKFVEDNREWLFPYAEFMAKKQASGGAAWNEWNNENSVGKAETAFWVFLQYEFFLQWSALKTYANARGVQIIGDMPIYVAYDSADVWQNPQYFQLDGNGTPTEVAGVPPDAFSSDGQLWGNPLYRWDEMQKDNFAWWKKRFRAALSMYDVVRIDHFRGFSDYYAIPFGESTARKGRWESAPGKELFAELKKEFPEAEIIAEDLGVIDDRVRELLRQTGFPGMKIAQFGFSEDDSGYNPNNYPAKCVAYTGTYDNPTTQSWAKHLFAPEKTRFRRCVRRRIGEADTTALVRRLLASAAQTVIIPIQDYLLLGDEGRINTPSTLGNNWIWRIPEKYARCGNKIKRLCALRQGGDGEWSKNLRTTRF